MTREAEERVAGAERRAKDVERRLSQGESMREVELHQQLTLGAQWAALVLAVQGP